MKLKILLGLVSALAGLLVAAIPSVTLAASAAKNAAGPSAKSLVDAATTDAAMREAFMKTGQRVADFCANCHGQNGISKMSDVPNMAAQNVSYLYEQMRRYLAADRRDNSAFKVGLIKLLKPEERAAVAYFYAHSPAIAAQATPGPLAAKGKSVYALRCAQCHGDDGAGAETIPRLAGQQKDYLRISLESYRKKTSGSQIAAKLESMRDMSKEDIAALVDYLSSMH